MKRGKAALTELLGDARLQRMDGIEIVQGGAGRALIGHQHDAHVAVGGGGAEVGDVGDADDLRELIQARAKRLAQTACGPSQ